MAIYERGKFYYCSFYWQGKHYQESTQVYVGKHPGRDSRAYKRAVAYEERRKAEVRDPSLVKVKREPVPTLQGFKERFVKSVETRCAEKPLTIEFYKSKLTNLLKFTPLADARLDQIDAGLIESYVQHRRKSVRPASVNRELATIRKLLRLALKWRVIDRVPMFTMLPGERERTFVLSHAQERIYLDFAPQPLHDLALLMLDTGLRVGEACAVTWADVHLEPVGSARFGYLHVRGGKTRYAKRNVPLTGRVRDMLEGRWNGRQSAWVFASADGKGPVSRFTVRDQHAALRKNQHLPADAVIHSLRHTALSRLGESGAGAFEIMRVAGHSSVTVSQKYVHPSPEAIERAFERLESMNARASEKLPEGRNPALPATNPATTEAPLVDTESQPI